VSLQAASASHTGHRIGDERWLVEIINTAAVEALARKQGWNGTGGLREFCEPEDAASCTEHVSLDAAVAAARSHLESGQSFYGCAIIEHQVFEWLRSGRGSALSAKPSWQMQRSYEVATDGECVGVAT
jgi:hypothetical protein